MLVACSAGPDSTALAHATLDLAGRQRLYEELDDLDEEWHKTVEATLEAVKAYQLEKSLAIGGLTLETIAALGVELP